jgi:putative acetyltransferase
MICPQHHLLEDCQMQIRLDDLNGPEIKLLLEEHLADMYAVSPPESVHALDLTKLQHPSISFWTVWDGSQLAGCGAIKQLDTTHAEIKSMRTANRYRGKGIGNILMNHILSEGKNRGYTKLSLETGSVDFFLPARKLYEKFGFDYCGPFADYELDPFSVFMMRKI